MREDDILDELMIESEHFLVRSQRIVGLEQFILVYFVLLFCLLVYRTTNYYGLSYVLNVQNIRFVLSCIAVLQWRKLTIEYDRQGRGNALEIPSDLKFFRIFLLLQGGAQIFYFFTFVFDYASFFFSGEVYEQYAFTGFDGWGMLLFYSLLNIVGGVCIIFYWHYTHQANIRGKQGL